MTKNYSSFHSCSTNSNNYSLSARVLQLKAMHWT